MTENQKVLSFYQNVQVPQLFSEANRKLQEAFNMLATAVEFEMYIEDEIYIDKILELCRTGR